MSGFVTKCYSKHLQSIPAYVAVGWQEKANKCDSSESDEAALALMVLPQLLFVTCMFVRRAFLKRICQIEYILTVSLCSTTVYGVSLRPKQIHLNASDCIHPSQPLHISPVFSSIILLSPSSPPSLLILCRWMKAIGWYRGEQRMWYGKTIMQCEWWGDG